MTTTEARRDAYWLLMQWRQRATNDLVKLSIRNLPKGMDNIDYLDRGMRTFAAGGIS